MWGETFDRDFDADAPLTVQDDLTDHVVASVADSYGALMRDLAAPVALNPNHPGWYRFSTFFDAFRQERYAEALDIAQRVNLPAYFPDPYTRAIAHAGLGHEREARQAAREFLALWPDGDLAVFSEKHLGRWFYAQPELAAAVIEGLERAGLDFDQGD